MNSNSRTAKPHGFTTVQMVITIAIISIVSSIGVLGVRRARAEFRWQNSARVFASYIEKARADSIRRHAGSGSESAVEIFGPGTNSYLVTMDFGDGAVSTRRFLLEPGVDFSTKALRIQFDWRGRLLVPCEITKACVFQVHSILLDDNIPVDVSGSGDITVGEQHFPDQQVPEVPITEITDDVDLGTPTPSPSGTPAAEGTPPLTDPGGDTGGNPDPVDSPSPSPTPTPHGNSDGNNGNGNGNPASTPTPGVTPTPPDGNPNATPTPTPAVQCVSSISPNTLSLSQSDSSKKTGTAVFTMVNASGVRTLTPSQVGGGNAVVLALSLQRIDGSGSSVLTVTTKRGAGNRGTFVVQVVPSPSCGSTATLTVFVSN